MKDYEAFSEVPADELVTLGVQDVMRTPADGVDRNTWISWDTAHLAVAASFEDMGKGLEPQHQIVIQNADGRGNSIAFSTEPLEDGTYNVATVSGWHHEGRAHLNPLQSEAFTTLVQKSIDAGPRQYR